MKFGSSRFYGLNQTMMVGGIDDAYFYELRRDADASNGETEGQEPVLASMKESVEYRHSRRWHWFKWVRLNR